MLFRSRYYNQFLAEGAAPLVARFSEVSTFARGKRVRISAGAGYAVTNFERAKIRSLTLL